MIIRPAHSDDASCLTCLSMRSKAHWGYSAEFMQACAEELAVSSLRIESEKSHYVVADIDDLVVGFYALEGLRGEEIELGALFVDPTHIGTGVGRMLMEEAKRHAYQLGARKLNIQSDPNAEKFYRAAGGVLIGSKKSGSVANRFLPMYQITL